jgi:hypothetical protein
MAGEYDDESGYGGGGGGYTGPAPLAVLGMGEQFTTPEALDYAKKILGRTVDGVDPMEGQDYLSRVKANSETARNALIKARERLAAQEYGRSEEWLAAAAAFGSPTRTGAFGETLGNVAGNLIEPRRKRREFNMNRDRQLTEIDLGLAGVDDKLLAAQLELMKLKQDRDTKMSTEALKILGRRVGASQEIPKRAAEAVDREYAKDYVEFVQTGASDAAKALEELGGARDQLRGYYVDAEGQKRRVRGGKKDTLTGPIVGTLSNLPWIGKTVQDVAFPESSDVQETVEYTVQRSLRPILGSQFTKEEGERLIARVYNPRLKEEVNAERLDRLIKQLERAYQAKIAAAQYFEEHQTLRGFKGKVAWTIDDIWPEEGRGSAPTRRAAPMAEEEAPANSLPPVEELPELDYESIVPAGEGLAKGGRVAYAEGGDVEEERVPHQMPDGRIIHAPAGVPYDRVLQRYEKAVGQSFARPPEDAAALEEPVQEPMPGDDAGVDFDAPTAVELGGSAIGQGLLGAAGGRYGMKTAHGLADLIPGHRASSAESRVLQGLENEGLSPGEWVKLVTRAQRLGVPMTGMDVGGIDLRALGEAAMHPENPETRQVYQETTARQAGSRERIDDQINKALKPDDYFAREKHLQKELKANAKPLYDDLSKKYPYLKSEQLMQLMNTPSGKKAVKNATKAIRDRPGATLGKTDAMGMITKPSIEFLDTVKDELDDMINKEEMAGGEYKATKKGKRLRELRNALRNEVDMLTTDPKTGVSAYKEARAQYAGDLEVRDSLRFGRNEFLKLPAGEVAEMIKDMNFTEKDALRTGVAQALFERTSKTGRRVNPADKVIDSADMQEKLKLLFDKPKEYEIFKEAMDLEMRMFDESKSTISKGKNVLSQPRDPNPNILKRTAKEAPTLGIFQPVQWALRYFRRKPELGKKEAAEILRILKTNDPTELKKLEARLTPKVGRAAARRGRVGKATMAGAALGAAFPFLKDKLGAEGEADEFGAEVDADEEVPRFARGGLVRRPTWARVTERVLNQSMFGGDDILSELSERME